MAAHSVNILSELAYPLSYGANAQRLTNLSMALGNTAGGDELDYTRWNEIVDLIDQIEALLPNPLDEEDAEARYKYKALEIELHKSVLLALRDQIAEWERLDFPATHGEWMDAKYPPGDDDDS